MALALPDPKPRTLRDRVAGFLGVYRYSGRALSLVWSTHRGLAVTMAVLTVIAGLLPAAVAYTGKLIVDAVLLAADTGLPAHRMAALQWVGLEAGLVAALALSQRGLDVARSLLRALLSQQVNVLILAKALKLDLAQFEDSDFYDRMTRARREASYRPLGLVNKTFGVTQNLLSLATYGVLLLAFSPAAVAVLLLAALPVFLAETRFAGEAFRIFRWQVPETRRRAYLEVVLAREDYAKEVKILGLGPMLLDRYKQIFEGLYDQDRRLALRRGGWVFALGLLSTAAFYGAYARIAISAIEGWITLGEMTMYLLVFKQGQSALAAILTAIGGMYEDNLYLSNLYEFLDEPVPARAGRATVGPSPDDGIRFEGVTFTYPGADRPAVRDLSLHLRPGQKLALVGENGSGKTTLIKLLTRLYDPDLGRITLDGLDLREWDGEALRRRVGVIFQDFVRYQMTVGENIGVGDVDAVEDETRWRDAAERGMALPFVELLPAGFRTQLGRWFQDGRELSLGQWQKVALSRAFMREHADILVLDEPTAAMDAEAEALIFERFREMTGDRMAIVISHRFSTVRMADEIAVLDQGRIVEQGSHERLMAEGGRYSRLFTLQAEGYR